MHRNMRVALSRLTERSLVRNRGRDAHRRASRRGHVRRRPDSPGGWVWCAPRRNIRSIWAGVAAASGCARGPYVRPFLSEGGDVLMCVETARIWQYPELDFLRPARNGVSRLPTECAPGCVERRAKRRDAEDRDRHWP